MSTEIKIQYKEVEQALANLRAKTKSLTTTFPTNIGGENQLDVLQRLNELGSDLQKLLNIYQSFLVKNEKATKEAVESMKELDERVSLQY
ncbi:YwqI/YxiC family protein [Heyndrickxia sporothermodurans]